MPAAAAASVATSSKQLTARASFVVALTWSAMIPGRDAQDCCSKCGQTSGCLAFTWSNYNGGTCWLKSLATGPTAAVAGVTSGIVGAANCAVETDVDYVGNDLEGVRGAQGECCAMCMRVGGCQAYTWSDFNGGTCWLKSSKGETKRSTGVVSGLVGGSTPIPTTPTPSPTTPTPTTPSPGADKCIVEAGVDYAGMDLTSAPGSSTGDCCDHCRRTEGCRAFTFAYGICYLKSGRGESKAALGIDSGIYMPPPPPHTRTLEYNVDYIGQDLGTAPHASVEDCVIICAGQVGCGAFTWSGWNGGTCFLKSHKGPQTRPSDGVVSGIVRADRPRTHIQYRLRSGELPLRSVNLGAWLVAEHMFSSGSPAWRGAAHPYWGEMITMSELGHGVGDRQFEEHRRMWITERDIAELASYGLNSVRVPVGYWIVNDDASTWSTDASRTFAPGALKYLDRLINDWAMRYNVGVMLSLHAHQGSQNGFDHSAPRWNGQLDWHRSGENIENSLQFATFLAARYQNSPAFLGMNLMNEPKMEIGLKTLQDYYLEAYRRIRATGNDCVLVTSPFLERQGPDDAFSNFMRWPQFTNVWHEFHVYFKWGYDGRNEWQLIDEAKKYGPNHLTPWRGNYLYMGEWSLASPSSAMFWDKDVMRQFAEVQMNQFRDAHSGWAFWTWRHDGDAKQENVGWSMRELLRRKIIILK